jgi:hypothetical protein
VGGGAMGAAAKTLGSSSSSTGKYRKPSRDEKKKNDGFDFVQFLKNIPGVDQMIENMFRFFRQIGLVPGGEMRAAMQEAQMLSKQRGRACHISRWWWCERSCDVDLRSLHSAHAKLMIDLPTSHSTVHGDQTQEATLARIKASVTLSGVTQAVMGGDMQRVMSQNGRGCECSCDVHFFFSLHSVHANLTITMQLHTLTAWLVERLRALDPDSLGGLSKAE